MNQPAIWSFCKLYCVNYFTYYLYCKLYCVNYFTYYLVTIMHAQMKLK